MPLLRLMPRQAAETVIFLLCVAALVVVEG